MKNVRSAHVFDLKSLKEFYLVFAKEMYQFGASTLR